MQKTLLACGDARAWERIPRIWERCTRGRSEAIPARGRSVGQYSPMRQTFKAAAIVTFLFVAAPGCGSSTASKASSSSTTALAGATTTAAATSGGSTTAYCSMLATAAGKTAAFAASIGTPQQAAKLAEIKADNDAIVAAAPSGIRSAVTKFYGISNLARAALDPSLSPADKAAAGQRAATAVGTPEAKAAIADYKAWVSANCGSLATTILSGGV